MSEYKEKTSMLGWALGTFLQMLFNLYLPLMAILILYVLVCGKQAKGECVMLLDEEYRWEYYDTHTLLLIDYSDGEDIARVELSPSCTIKPKMQISEKDFTCTGNKIAINDKLCRVKSMVKIKDQHDRTR